MAWVIALDAGIVGLLCCSMETAGVADCGQWLVAVAARGAVVTIPDLTDYEVRRGLLAVSARRKLERLDALRGEFRSAAVTPSAWARAAEFWAGARRGGRPTADPRSLDADCVLAAVADAIARRGNRVTIATTNVAHLDRFPGIDARDWKEID